MQASEDVPILIAAGCREERLRLFTVVHHFWAALSSGLSWPRVRWIGGEFSLLQDGVAVQLAEAKIQTAKVSIDEILHGQATLPVKKLMSVIGYMSWIASVAPVARPFVSVLWEHSLIIPSGRRRKTPR